MQKTSAQIEELHMTGCDIKASSRNSLEEQGQCVYWKLCHFGATFGHINFVNGFETLGLRFNMCLLFGYFGRIVHG